MLLLILKCFSPVFSVVRAIPSPSTSGQWVASWQRCCLIGQSFLESTTWISSITFWVKTNLCSVCYCPLKNKCILKYERTSNGVFPNEEYSQNVTSLTYEFQTKLWIPVNDVARGAAPGAASPVCRVYWKRAEKAVFLHVFLHCCVMYTSWKKT